jgi:hypothetical protein
MIDDKKKWKTPDLLVLAHVVVLVAGIAISLAACQKQEPATAAPAPSKALVQAMLEYCKIGDLPRDQQRDAQKVWGFQNGGDKEIGPIWNRAARDKDPATIKLVRAAATLAMGGEDKCPILDILDHPERVQP